MALLVASMALLAGCYPNDPTNVEQYDLVLTNYDSSFNFTNSKTFSLPDQVVVITGDKPDSTKPLTYVSEPYNTQILNSISQNLSAKGWTEVGANDDPDMMLLPSAFQNTTISYYYDYYYYWGGYYGGYYGWYYPGYYPVYYTSYTTGTLFVTMVDPNAVTPANELPVRWMFLVNGLLTGDYSATTIRIGNTIDQAFEQSPYLAK
ncbi:MAG: DUF4136 domain-containing protein [Chitinophagaceae bacterium]|nr:DUF4136 domain-containing protein [Chitinophagaceae bacterium]